MAKLGMVILTHCDHLGSLSSDLAHIPTPDTPCLSCQNPPWNWLCLSCKEVLCSRYVNKHMLHHYRQKNHCLSLSFSDLSVWCYCCNAYLDAQVISALRPVYETAYVLKFGAAPPSRAVNDVLHHGGADAQAQGPTMASNKERIEVLGASVKSLQDNFSRLELGFADRFQQLEDAINKLSEAILRKQDESSKQLADCSGYSSNGRGRDQLEGARPMFFPKLAKLKFPKYSGEDPTEWLTKAEQFFEYHSTPEQHKVSLASFHLEGEAYQWWQWLRKAYQEEEKEVLWGDFLEELRERFGPTDSEKFGEYLSKIQQTGSLREYQKEFERLGNQVRGWTQKALISSFIGGLKPEIADGIRMFKPKTLKEAIGMARMKDDQWNRQQKISHSSTSTNLSSSLSAVKRLSLEEMQPL